MLQHYACDRQADDKQLMLYKCSAEHKVQLRGITGYRSFFSYYSVNKHVKKMLVPGFTLIWAGFHQCGKNRAREIWHFLMHWTVEVQRSLQRNKITYFLLGWESLFQADVACLQSLADASQVSHTFTLTSAEEMQLSWIVIRWLTGWGYFASSPWKSSMAIYLR